MEEAIKKKKNLMKDLGQSKKRNINLMSLYQLNEGRYYFIVRFRSLTRSFFCFISICTKYQRHGRVKLSATQIHAFTKKIEKGNNLLISETQCVLYNVRLKAMTRSF